MHGGLKSMFGECVVQAGGSAQFHCCIQSLVANAKELLRRGLEPARYCMEDARKSEASSRSLALRVAFACLYRRLQQLRVSCWLPASDEQNMR